MTYAEHCDCEHTSHFEDSDEHPYRKAPAEYLADTEYGLYAFCDVCVKGHMKGHTKWERRI